MVNEAAADADLIVTSGGISMGGERDSIKAAMQGLGAASFCTVAIHPASRRASAWWVLRAPRL